MKFTGDRKDAAHWWAQFSECVKLCDQIRKQLHDTPPWRFIKRRKLERLWEESRAAMEECMKRAVNAEPRSSSRDGRSRAR